MFRRQSVIEECDETFRQLQHRDGVAGYGSLLSNGDGRGQNVIAKLLPRHSCIALGQMLQHGLAEDAASKGKDRPVEGKGPVVVLILCPRIVLEHHLADRVQERFGARILEQTGPLDANVFENVAGGMPEFVRHFGLCIPPSPSNALERVKIGVAHMAGGLVEDEAIERIPLPGIVEIPMRQVDRVTVRFGLIAAKEDVDVIFAPQERCEFHGDLGVVDVD